MLSSVLCMLRSDNRALCVATAVPLSEAYPSHTDAGALQKTIWPSQAYTTRTTDAAAAAAWAFEFIVEFRAELSLEQSCSSSAFLLGQTHSQGLGGVGLSPELGRGPSTCILGQQIRQPYGLNPVLGAQAQHLEALQARICVPYDTEDPQHQARPADPTTYKLIIKMKSGLVCLSHMLSIPCHVFGRIPRIPTTTRTRSTTRTPGRRLISKPGEGVYA